MKYIKRILYTLSIIIPSLFIVFDIYILNRFLPEYLKNYNKKINNTKYNIIFLSIIIINIIIFKISTIYRIKLRNEIETDKNGISNRKYNNFSKLSKKEKNEIDKKRIITEQLLISKDELQKITHIGSKNSEEDLKKLVGLNNVKQNIEKLEAAIKMYHQNYNSSMHFCFYGNPGTGKTTVARILTGILYKNKYIKKNKYIEIDGNFLKGYSNDSTNRKLNIILNTARNGVLFIDEAYSLNDSVFGKQIIDTLMKEMEDQSKNIVIILAGYKNEMNKLIKSNPGFKSRIKYYYDFPNYNNQELTEIFQKCCYEKKFYLPFETLDRFSEIINKEMKKENFGNARTVRNIIEQAIEQHAYNYVKHIIPKDKEKVLMPEDLL